MPKFSAIVYAHSDDASALERTLPSIETADDVLVINAENTNEIRDVGRYFHSRLKVGIPGVTPGAYLLDAYHDWILVMRPGEEVSDELSRSLAAWRREKYDNNAGFRFDVLEWDGANWCERRPEVRLVNRRKINWIGELPPNADAPSLRGPILRYETESQARRIA